MTLIEVLELFNNCALDARGDQEPISLSDLRRTDREKIIKKAYRKKCLHLHPDKNSGCKEEFVTMQNAYYRINTILESPLPPQQQPRS